jgi:hypothetical protein
VKRADAGTWARLGETALLALVFLGPLAAHGRTYDPAALRVALFQSVALTLVLAWILKGLARGRWEAASASLPALVPALALGLWLAVRFAAAPFKAAALPGASAQLGVLFLYAAAVLELGGARHAARAAFWTAAAAALASAAGALQRLSGAPVSATLASPARLAAFAALALPAVLSLRLDPEASPVRRAFSASAALALALLCAWTGSPGGQAAFALSALVFAAAVLAVLRGSAARRAALLSLACGAGALLPALGAGWTDAAARALDAATGPAAAARALWRLRPLTGAGPGSLFPGALAVAPTDSLALRALAETGLIGLLLLLWTVAAGAYAGLRAAVRLRRRGAAAEAGYAAAFAAAFAAWALAAGAGLIAPGGAAEWLAWIAGGVAAGMAPLARPGGVVRTIPLAVGAEARRLLQGPVLALFLVLAAAPAGWLASDVRFNRAVAADARGDLDSALADASAVWPGSAVYPQALYLRGRALMDQDRPAEALAAYARLDAVAPGFLRVHARKAEADAELGLWADAARERALQSARDPSSVRDLVAWAETARAAGDLDQARRAADRARALAPEDPAVRLQVAANRLLERRLAAEGARRRAERRRGTALKPGRRSPRG